MPERIGLCAKCRFAVVQQSAKRSRFWRCRLAEESDRFLRYPPLPVRRCAGFVPGRPNERGRDDPAGPRPL